MSVTEPDFCHGVTLMTQRLDLPTLCYTLAMNTQL